MRISAKGRYALAASIYMAQQYGSGQYITVISISESLGISKIYLEQVFSLLKRGGLVNSVKGAQGGYQLVRSPEKITVYDVLSAVELLMFEPAEETVAQKAPHIDKAMSEGAFSVLDNAVKSSLEKITLAGLIAEAEKYVSDQGYMYYL